MNSCRDAATPILCWRVFCITMKIMTEPGIRPIWREKRFPFGARILRICDVYCALTSDRPYRSAFTAGTGDGAYDRRSKKFRSENVPGISLIHSGSRKAIELSDVDELIQEIIKEKTENGIKEKTGKRNERYFTERNGNP